MWTMVTSCCRAKALLIDLFCYLTDTSILVKTQYCDLTIMVSCTEKELVFIICRKVTTSHSIDRSFIDKTK